MDNLVDHEVPRESPHWPAFEAWVAENLPNGGEAMMLSVYWACFKAGIRHGRDNPKAQRSNAHGPRVPAPEFIPEED